MSLRNGFWYKSAVVLLVLALILPALTACDDDDDDTDMTPAMIEESEETTSAETQMLVDPIKTDAGLVSGTIEGDTENPVHFYQGIPYAAPPVGELRWMPPQPVVPWEGIRECTSYSPWTAQSWPPPVADLDPDAYPSEDCLYLNLLTPAKNTDDRLPVMVWFHGGGLTTGSGNEPAYNTIHLPQRGVVTVIVNQRLGPLGYMAHPLLSEEQEASGNYGTMDLIAALKWVQNNITAFGGDPDRVTIFGESGGGTKVTSLLASPEARVLFHGGIIQSGSRGFTPDSQLTLAEAEAQGLELMEACGATSLEEMRALPWETIIEQSAAVDYTTSLTVDGRILPDMVYNMAQAGQQNDVPIIVGANKWENTFFESITIPAEAWGNVNSNCYVYIFNHMPGNWSDMYAPHGVEVGYMFGTPENMAAMNFYFSFVTNINHIPPDDPRWVEPSNPDPGLDESDDYVKEAMMSMWAQFAATGDPSVSGLPTWPTYDAKDPQYLEIAAPLQATPWIEEEVFYYKPAAPSAQPTTGQPSVAELTIDSTLQEIFNAPGGEALLRECLGDSLVDNPLFSQGFSMSLPSMAPYTDIITDEIVDCVDAGLHELASGETPTVSVPTVEGPITDPGTPFKMGMLSDKVLTAAEYETDEFFISGTAMSYHAVNDLPANGMWEVEPAESAPYKVRILVQRPEDPATFNGTVVMEWFNVSAGVEGAPDLLAMHTELFRHGYAWIGVSAQYVGVEGGPAALSSQKMDLKTVDPERYGSLSHPGDSYSYDIFSQAANAIRNPGKVDLLAGYDVERILAVGESQSAYRLTAYYNAVQPHVQLFDGFLIHSRGGGAAPLGDEALDDIDFSSMMKLRTDLNAPVLILQTESDLFLLGYYESRQDDTDTIRLWEMAGTSHADLYQLGVGANDTGTDPAVANLVEVANPYPGFVECDFPINSGPQHFIAKAAIHQLDNWVRTGNPPPTADRLEITGDPPAFVLDEFGNVKGGIRTPYVDVPIAKLSGLGQPGDISTGTICALFGTTKVFDEATLTALYPDHATYATAVENATDAAVQAGFLMPEDGELIKAAAATYDPAAPPVEPPDTTGITIKSTIGEIMEAPGGEAVLRECLGDEVVDSSQWPMAFGMTMTQIESLSEDITGVMVACVDAGLQALASSP